MAILLGIGSWQDMLILKLMSKGQTLEYNWWTILVYAVLELKVKVFI